MIRKRMLALMALPLATLFLEAQNGPSSGAEKTYSIVGRVKRPGTYPLTKPTTVLEAINAAGGLSDSESMEIQVARGNRREAFMFIYKDGVRALQMELQSDDVITARPSGRLDHIRLPPPP